MNQLNAAVTGETVFFQIESDPFFVTGENHFDVRKINERLCQTFDYDTGGEITPHCIYADSHSSALFYDFSVRQTFYRNLRFGRDDLFAIVLSAGSANPMGHDRSFAARAEGCGNAFITVGSFALTALHTGGFTFWYSHF